MIAISLRKTPKPTVAQSIRAVRAIDGDGKSYWFCSYGGDRITTHPDRCGYFCPGCNAIAPRIERVRTFRS